MISIIVAIAENGVVGIENKLPWPPKSIPRDMPHFIEQTRGSTVISGKNTFLGMGILPKRRNVVVSKTLSETEGVVRYTDLGPAIEYERSNAQEIFLLGGTKIWAEGMRSGNVDRVLITRVHKKFEGDTFFPEGVLREHYRKIYSTEWKVDDPEKIPATFEVWIKK